MNYQVVISPVKSHKAAVLKLLPRFLGPDEKDKVEKLVQKGGTVLQNLNKQAATTLANQLRKLGAEVEIILMKPEESNEQFLVRLLSAGKYEAKVIKVVRDLTKSSPKEAKEIVYRLGVVAENLSKKEAEHIKKILETVGAKVRIEEMSISGPEPKPENPKDSEQPESNVVSGQVYNSKGMQLPFAPIVLVDKNVGKDIQLAHGQSEKDGSYEIHYKTKVSTDHPDIQVHLISDQKKKKQILAKSTIRYNAKQVEEHLDIVVPVEKLPEADPEYTRLLTKLKDRLAIKTEAELTKKLAALKEDDDQQDITYLANKTGWDARLVAMMALAHEKSAETDLPAPLFYALYRAALPTGETALFNTNPYTVHKIWKKAIEQNIIDAAWEDQINKYLNLFKKNRAKNQLNDEISGSVSTLDQMLSLSLKDEKQKQEFAERYFHQNPEEGDFWAGIEEQFGPDLKKKLQLDGKLGVLTLNNAPLIQQLRDQESIREDPIELVHNGFYNISAWENILEKYGIQLPSDLPGEADGDKQKVYAAAMAQQLKASYPTAVLAAQVSGQEFTLAEANSHTQVVDFLNTHQASFAIGQQPLTQFIKEQELVVEKSLANELKRLERLYQMSPSDEAMKILSGSGIDSAHAAVQMGEDVVVSKLVSGGLDKAQAQLVYAKSQQVQGMVLNVATTVMTQKNLPAFHVLNPAGNLLNNDNNDGIIGYPTLEGLFGEMDFCDCKHCRSVLSPAAYLVDLLNFIDKDPSDFDNRTGENPVDVLLKRRPDIAHIQLTCENTNTVLPYIDLVNEILEHYSVNKSLTHFNGYNNTGDRSTEELLANPQFVKKEAYKILKEQVYPFQTPFNQPLAALRRLFDHLEVPLSQAIRLLPAHDEAANDETDNNEPTPVENISMEYLKISPEEYAIFTKNEKSIAEYYGEDTNADLYAVFTQNNTFAKDFSRKVGVSYKELTRLVKTRFINPASSLIPKLESLKISIHIILEFIDGNIDNDNFDVLLPDELKEGSDDFKEDLFDGDVKAWLRERNDTIKSLIFLIDPDDEGNECSFVQLELLRDKNTPITDLDYFKFMRFIRFWKKLGWTIEQTDKTITALWPNTQEADTVESLNEGFATLINRTAHLKRVMALLNSNPKRDLLKVLGLFGFIDTQAPHSLYKELFLNTSITNNDAVFSANSSVDYLTDKETKILDHEPAILAAFNLNSENLRLIVSQLKTTQFNSIEKVPLNLENVTTIHRYAYLGRELKLSVQELFILQDLTQINPFDELEEINPSLIKFIELVKRLKESPLTIPQLTYYLRHEDISGEASPSDDDLRAMAYQLKKALQQVENDYQAIGDVTGESVRSKMVLVYPQETVDQFFSIVKNDLSFSTSYDHHESILEDKFQQKRQLSYNDFQKTLAYNGIMSDKELSNFQNAADVISEAGDRNEFLSATQVLYDDGQTALQNLFNDYPELKEPYQDFTKNQNFDQLLTKILDDFKKLLKKQTVIQTLGDALGIEHDVVTTFLDNKAVLHANAESALDNPKNAPAVEDYLALETNGVSAVYVFDDGSEKKQKLKNINTSPQNPEFPDTPSIKKVTYSFYVEITEKAFYNFSLKTNGGAEVSLSVNKEEKEGSLTNGSWENTEPIELAAHRYHLIEIWITDLNDTAILKWATENKSTYRLLPNDKLYPKQSIQIFKQSYLRFLKASTLLTNLEMSQKEIRYFGAAFKIKEAGFLNAIPTHFDPTQTAIHIDLLQDILHLLAYQQLKEGFDVEDNKLISVLHNPMATYRDSQDKEKSLLLKTTGWTESNLNELLKAFDLERSDLKDIDNFFKVWEAYQLVDTSSLPAKTLLEATTNSPDSDSVKTLKQALRLKYDTNAWLQVIQPINDSLRNEQRDALVAYVLRLMEKNDNTKTIDTADKLFEYFLIDVEMDPCMKTSRIKQAISSVQLFVQRVLLNLEQQKGENSGVDTASINSKQWEWMKRYRVWEANRKVFISPENWLEPELRDNKSPFFKEMESELLQSDITEDQARTVMLGYLEKLDDVAKLDIAGMCLQENQKTKDKGYFEEDDVLHVFGKTQGTSTKYYYRRYEGGYFTPWEKVDLDIEGAPVLPIIWNDRLFLFWLNIIQKGVKNDKAAIEPGGSSKKLMDAKFDSSALEGNSKINVEISLSWSEYFNGKWQPRRMSDVDEPVVFKYVQDNSFTRSSLKIKPYKLDGLWIKIKNFNGEYGNFYLKNKYTARPAKIPRKQSKNLKALRSFNSKNAMTQVTYENFSQKILLKGIESSQPAIFSSPYYTPFFLQNDEHVFFVQLNEEWISIQENNDFGILKPVFDPVANIELTPVFEKPDTRVLPGQKVDNNPGNSTPFPEEYNFGNDNIKIGLPDNSTIHFKGREVGAFDSKYQMDVNKDQLFK